VTTTSQLVRLLYTTSFVNQFTKKSSDLSVNESATYFLAEFAQLYRSNRYSEDKLQ